ncbi:MAG: heme NO-binding domain-containing protein [Deltaproteobacteria bacterium]|nr:MAG: heme NO-binding domain-containing protein [Deltaproteobacteria bacterium]
MKGVIFSIFNEMIEEKFGLELWDRMIEETKPVSKGIYTSAQSYHESELFSYVGLLSKETGISVEDLVRTFGHFTLIKLSKLYPDFLVKDFKEFLKTIDSVIHAEVKKIYPDAGLPSFTYEDPAPNQLVMIYKSPRKLCHLAEGLIAGAAEHYQTKHKLSQTKCMHLNDPHCRFELTIGE